jgi:predicted nucleic acid-binding protein
MLIVSDTGPLRYLIEVDAIGVLPVLYGKVWTTPSVLAELSAAGFPDKVRRWAREVPGWLLVEQPLRIEFLDVLDAGEAAALSLAVERKADAVLIDERDGTRLARANGIRTLGTLAVLMEAGHAGLLDFHMALNRLVRETRFHHSKRLIAEVQELYETTAKAKGG